MDKKFYQNARSHRINGHKNERIGIPIGIHDKNGIELKTGDKIKWGHNECRVLWCTENNEYMALLCYSMWNGTNEYDQKSYAKGYSLRMDDGARMEIEKINE